MNETNNETNEKTDPGSKPPLPSWSQLDLSAETISVLHKAGFATPTPIQAQSIPFALQGRDVIASAQTGTGKTAAFALPIIEKTIGRSGTFALILAPTREIALQIEATVKLLGAPLGVTSASLIGGTELSLDKVALSKYPNVLVATPGRLCDHLERGNIWLEFIEFLVLDEADKMLDMGFADQLKKITDEIPHTRQTLLFSATISPMVERLARHILNEPEQVNAGKRRSATENVEQRLLWMKDDHKNSALRNLMRQERGSMIVFVRSKDRASRLWRTLHSNGFYDVTCIHSDLRQQDREQALQAFKDGKFRVLIATDVVGRGIHVDGIAHVVNFDLPLEADDYIHRIGRTGRLDTKGKATTFMTSRDTGQLRDIERLLQKQIPDEQADGTRPDRTGGAHRSERSRSGHGGGHGRSNRGGGRGGRR